MKEMIPLVWKCPDGFCVQLDCLPSILCLVDTKIIAFKIISNNPYFVQCYAIIGFEGATKGLMQ